MYTTPLAEDKAHNRVIDMKSANFYRVLYTNENITAWKEGRYHSGHLSPSEWFKIWNTTTSLYPQDYPLDCPSGYFSSMAREVFLKAASENRVNKLTTEEAKQICEQAGVCAFTTPEAAYNYLMPESPARKLQIDRYVEFTGEKMKDDNAEGEGAVIAHVIKTNEKIFTRVQFKSEHQLQGD